MLIIVESPSKAKTISRIVGNKYTVKASVGHIRQISDTTKNKAGDKLEINGIDINSGFEPIFEVDEKKKKVVAELKKIVAGSKEEILFATDEDREGEAISWHLAQVLKVPEDKVKRLVFHEITSSAIENALKNPRPLDLKMVTAQKARQVLDKLVGYKLSPVLWKVMNNNHLSAGRVQTPALKLVFDREQEILSFVASEFWEVFGIFDPKRATASENKFFDTEQKKELKEQLEAFNTLKLKLFAGKKIEESELASQEKVEKLLAKIILDPVFKVISASQKNETNRSKPPFITSTLQQSASSRYGFTPKQTMSLAQKLYEGIDIDGRPTALITYMRTDSTNLSMDAIQNVRKFLSQKYPEFLPKENKYYKSKSKNAQEAHEAIRPVDIFITPDKLKGKLEPSLHKLYDLIWRRTVACQMTDEIKERFSYELQNSQKDEYQGSVAVTVHLGFKRILEENFDLQSEKELYQKVSNYFSQDKVLYLQTNLAIQSFTQPPSRYSPASLVKKLEELGIGRPSTYASIISTIQDRGYVEITKNVIFPTTLGMSVARLLVTNFENVTSPSLTADLEENLDEISRGEKKYLEVLDYFWWPFKKEVEDALPKLQEVKSQYNSQQTDVLDPKDGTAMVLKMGRFGEYYQNPNKPENIYPKNFRESTRLLDLAKAKYSAQLEGKKCEDCQKPLVLKISGKSLNPYIACPDYRVGNKHTVMSLDYGICPQCESAGRSSHLRLKTSRGAKFLACELDKKVCGYTQKWTEEV